MDTSAKYKVPDWVVEDLITQAVDKVREVCETGGSSLTIWTDVCKVIDQYRPQLRQWQRGKRAPRTYNNGLGTAIGGIQGQSETGLGKRIRFARLQNNMSQAYVCKEILGDLHQSLYSRWEKGTREPNAEQLDALAECYGVTTAWLLTGEEAPHE